MGIKLNQMPRVRAASMKLYFKLLCDINASGKLRDLSGHGCTYFGHIAERYARCSAFEGSQKGS